MSALRRRDGIGIAAQRVRNRRNGLLRPDAVLKAAYVPEVLAVMATAGLYDDSGKWLYATGLPAKSGVGGGIIAVSPGKFGIAVISPPLDAAGTGGTGQRGWGGVGTAGGGTP